MQQRQICDKMMVTPDKFTNEAEGQLGLVQHTHTTELKALGFPITDLQTGRVVCPIDPAAPLEYVCTYGPTSGSEY